MQHSHRRRSTRRIRWYVDDSVTHHWTGTSGLFADDDFIGTSVQYICTNSSGSETVTAYADDDYVFGDGTPENEAVYDEAYNSSYVTVNVIIPVVETILYGGGKHTITGVTTPEYDRSANRNEPVSYTMLDSDTTAAVTFSHASSLSEGSSVELFGDRLLLGR